MTAASLYHEGLAGIANLKLSDIKIALRNCNEGAIESVLNTNGEAYYLWLPCAIDVLKPKQIVELGGAMGVSAIMMCQSNVDFKLYSITLPEGGLEFSFIADPMPKLTKVVGDDLVPLNWPKDLDLSKTDLWFFDALHEEQHLRKELALYEPFFKEGAVLLFDDIHTFGLEPVWEDLKSKYESWDCTDPLHFSGFGLCIV